MLGVLLALLNFGLAFSNVPQALAGSQLSVTAVIVCSTGAGFVLGCEVVGAMYRRKA